MFTRTKQAGQTTITATFSFDPGDPSVGIGPGWGEETGVEIKSGPFLTFLTFIDREEDGSFIPNVEDWIVDQVSVYHGEQWILLADSDDWNRAVRGRVQPIKIWRGVLRLSELPEVLEVVQAAYDDYVAAERLSEAQETVGEAQAYLGELEYSRDHPEYGWQPPEGCTPEKIAQAKAEVEEAMRDLERATEEMRNRTWAMMEGYPLLRMQRASKPPCAWCGESSHYAAEMWNYESDRTEHAYLFCSQSCMQTFIKDSNDTSGD